jgi:hypothetical protein
MTNDSSSVFPLAHKTSKKATNCLKENAHKTTKKKDSWMMELIEEDTGKIILKKIWENWKRSLLMKMGKRHISRWRLGK